MKGPARLDTARLVLRKPTLADAEAIYHRYASDAQVTRFLGWPRHWTIDDTRSFLQWSEAQWHEHPAGPYLIESGAGVLLGSAGLEFSGPHQAATGYVLARDAWGQGYATEALRAVIAVARRLQVRELQAICHAGHAASRRVLEKCGFRCAGQVAVQFPNLQPGESGDARRYELPLA